MLIVNFFVKNKDWGRGGGLLTFSSEKGGGGLIREGGLIWEGGLIEDLRYAKMDKANNQPSWLINKLGQ